MPAEQLCTNHNPTQTATGQREERAQRSTLRLFGADCEGSNLITVSLLYGASTSPLQFSQRTTYHIRRRTGQRRFRRRKTIHRRQVPPLPGTYRREKSGDAVSAHAKYGVQSMMQSTTGMLHRRRSIGKTQRKSSREKSPTSVENARFDRRHNCKILVGSRVLGEKKPCVRGKCQTRKQTKSLGMIPNG